MSGASRQGRGDPWKVDRLIGSTSDQCDVRKESYTWEDFATKGGTLRGRTQQVSQRFAGFDQALVFDLLFRRFTEELATERRKREALEHRLSTIEALFENGSSTESPLEDTSAFGWMQRERDLLSNEHAGQHVAIHPIDGVVASGESLAELYDKLDARGIDDSDDLLIHTVQQIED